MKRFGSLLGFAGTALVVVGCGDYWGPGPDPGRAGPFTGELPPSAGTPNNTSGATSNCDPEPCGSGATGQGATGQGGTGEVGTVIASNIGNGIGDIALDDDFVYFTTNQGIARVSKQGGEAEPLGGFNQPSGIAVAGGNVYLVENNGTVVTVPTEGGKTSMLVPSGNNGSGSGSLALDSKNIFYTVGGNLRRAPVQGGSFSNIAGEVFQGGVSAHRLALDATFVYYVSAMEGMGALAQLRKMEKDAAATPDQGPPGRVGTLVFTARGFIPAIVWDGEFIYFSDLGSDGLNPQLELRKLVGDKPPTLLATVTPTNVNPSGNGGGALATDGHMLYFAGPRGLHKVPVTGGAVETIDENAMTGALAVDGTDLFWADQNQNGTLRRIEK